MIVKNDPIEYIFHSPRIDGFSGPGWYFWDESWTCVYGPYRSAQEARAKCTEYAKLL
jgi:hypothetical protein